MHRPFLKNAPGIKPGVFIIKFSKPYFRKGDCITCASGMQVRVTKIYKYTWYKKILSRVFGIPFKMYNCVKVEEIN